jgi:hypothetical protein
MVENSLMPRQWTLDQKLFPHQAGFTCPPFDFDAAPTDFLGSTPPTVGWVVECCMCPITNMGSNGLTI